MISDRNLIVLDFPPIAGDCRFESVVWGWRAELVGGSTIMVLAIGRWQVIPWVMGHTRPIERKTASACYQGLVRHPFFPNNDSPFIGMPTAAQRHPPWPMAAWLVMMNSPTLSFHSCAS